NPNSLGTVAATIFAVLLSNVLVNLEGYFINPKEKHIKRKILFGVTLSALAVSLVINSASRTSFLTVLACLAVGLIYLTISLTKQKKLGIFIIKGGLATGVIIVA